MTYEQALDKVKKLLKIAHGRKNSTPEEAATFLAKAQALMDEYDIEVTLAELDGTAASAGEEIVNENREPVLRCCQKDKFWSVPLVTAIAKNNGCDDYYYTVSGGAQCHLIGRRRDIETARYLIGFMKQQISSLAREHTAGQSDHFRRDFKLGIVDVIRWKLAEQKRQTQEEMKAKLVRAQIAAGQNANMALVRIDNAIAKIERRHEEAEAFFKQQFPDAKSARERKKEADLHARILGQTIAKQKLKMSAARAGISDAAKAIEE